MTSSSNPNFSEALEPHDPAHVLTRFEIVVALLNVLERVLLRDQVIDVELPLVVKTK